MAATAFFFFFLDLAAAASSWGERERYARGGEKTRERLGLGGRGPPLGWAGLVRFPSKHKKKKKLDCWENVRHSDFQPFGLEQKIRLGNTLIEENNDLGKSAETETKQKIEKMFGTMNPTNSFYGQ